ncbi:hypothetical protein J6590_030803 [Homalodisca vitripennis]|nr:hypothetical protein J6590_030803 [Homalodisca vitripennis]
MEAMFVTVPTLLLWRLLSETARSRKTKIDTKGLENEADLNTGQRVRRTYKRLEVY